MSTRDENLTDEDKFHNYIIGAIIILKSFYSVFAHYIEKNINIDELIFDFSIIIFFLLISYYLRDSSGGLSEVLLIETILVLLITVELLCPWYLGEIYGRYNNKGKGSLIYKLSSVFVLFIGLALSIIICFFLPLFLLDGYDFSILSGFYILANFIFAPLAIIIGWEYGSKYQKTRNEAGYIAEGFFPILYPFLFIIMPITLLALISFSNIRALIIVIFALLLIPVLKDVLKKIFETRIARLYIFPMMLCLSLEFSQIVIMEFLERNVQIHSFAVYSITSMMIISARVMLFLSPPVRSFNFFIGIICLGIYLFYKIN